MSDDFTESLEKAVDDFIDNATEEQWEEKLKESNFEYWNKVERPNDPN